MMLERIGYQKDDANVELLRLVDIEKQTLDRQQPSTSAWENPE